MNTAPFYAQFDRIEAGSRGPHAPAPGEQAGFLAAALVTHARLEDELLFDRLAAAGADPALLHNLLDEHARIAELLSEAQSHRDADRAQTCQLDAVLLARDHFAREERFAFPLAESVLGGGLAELGAVWAERRTVFLAASPISDRNRIPSSPVVPSPGMRAE